MSFHERSVLQGTLLFLCDRKFCDFLSHKKERSAKDAQLAAGKLAVNGTARARRLRRAQSIFNEKRYLQNVNIVYYINYLFSLCIRCMYVRRDDIVDESVNFPTDNESFSVITV